MDGSTCHEREIDLLKDFLYEMFIFCLFSLVLNMIFTLTLKEGMSRNICADQNLSYGAKDLP